jgi:UPF0755 protein
MPKVINILFRILGIVIIFGVFVSALALGSAAYLNTPPKKGVAEPSSLSDSGTRVEGDLLYLEVRRGESADSVGRRLENAGIIRNRHFWSLLFRLDKEQVKTGTYQIYLPANLTHIRSVLIRGEQLLVRVTFPEGVTLKKTARILEDSGICSTEDFLDAAFSREIMERYRVNGVSMEGFLFPDTYLFPLGFPASRVIQIMADTFYKRLEGMLGEAALSMNITELNNRVIIASIVEREYRLPEEAALMAGVFYNRLRIGMALQSCATVEYVITEIQGRPHPTVLYNRDLEIRDPYNTYYRPGLPPGPISAPGETALKAAFSPEQSEFLYFRLIDLSSGRHYFSRTLDEHIRAGTLYVKGR